VGKRTLKANRIIACTHGQLSEGVVRGGRILFYLYIEPCLLSGFLLFVLHTCNIYRIYFPVY